MTREANVIFLKNPNRVLEQLVKNFVAESELNGRTQLGHGLYFGEPLVGFASGNDPLFSEYKTLIGSFHLTPRELIAAALKEKGRELLLSEAEQVSVISWVLPIAEDVRKSNRQEAQFPSRLWTFTREYGEIMNQALRRHVAGFLGGTGYLAVVPLGSPSYRSFRDDRVGWGSSWSERHIAYACGLGTFSLNDGLITPRGMAMRVGSVVTLLKLTPSERVYQNPRENCLFFRGEKCGKCIPRCPAGAISEKGHDKDKCNEYISSEPLNARRKSYGLENPPTACGLCQTGVPCEFRIPRPNLIA